jgi:hypothetical protein
MIRTGAALGLLLLAGCGSGASNPIVSEALGQLRGRVPGTEAPAGPPPRAITRESIEASGAATILARLERDESPSTLFAASENGGYVTFVSGFRQSITLRGSQITATRGLGHDLLSASSGPLDPVARPVPPEAWPARVERRYEFPAEAPQGRVEVYECRIEIEEPGEMTILGRTYQGVQITEYCDGEYGRFENLHFAELGTGFVRRSLQWVGPEMDLIDLQVVEPYTGN